MTPHRTITLTERRPAVRRVAAADLADLAGRFGHVVDIAPTHRRGVVRVTARGVAGWFATSGVRWVVRPKLPWADLARMAAGDTADARGPAVPAPVAFADLLGRRLADLMRERADAGLVHGYREVATESAAVRGRVDFAKLARTPHPTLFPVVADEFTLDVPWNRVPRAAADRLLAGPDLSPDVRAALAAAAARFPAAPDPSDIGLTFDARTEPYRPLIGWSRLVLGAAESGGFLVNLETLFQRHVERLLAGPRVRFQVPVPLLGPGAVTFRPDVLVEDGAGTPVGVWDAKWKPLRPAGPDPTDAQQVLAYAAAVGCRAAGLVYPGRTFAVRSWVAPSGVTLTAVRLRVAGPAEACDRAADRLRRNVMGR